MQQKIQKMFFGFEIIALELITSDPRFYWEIYFSLGVNMLTNTLKISDTTKTEFIDLTSFQSDQKIWQRYCRADLSSLSDPLTCWPSISVLTWSFLRI